MVWLIGHRQPKGAATAMLEPTATAPHLDSTPTCASRLRLSHAGELKLQGLPRLSSETMPSSDRAAIHRSYHV